MAARSRRAPTGTRLAACSDAGTGSTPGARVARGRSDSRARLACRAGTPTRAAGTRLACRAGTPNRVAAARAGLPAARRTARRSELAAATGNATSARCAAGVRGPAGAWPRFLAAGRAVGTAAVRVECLGRIEPRHHQPPRLGRSGLRQLRAGALGERPVLPPLRHPPGLAGDSTAATAAVAPSTISRSRPGPTETTPARARRVAARPMPHRAATTGSRSSTRSARRTTRRARRTLPVRRRVAARSG
jgi:hypothetical protein